jgi:hypothetical protein
VLEHVGEIAGMEDVAVVHARIAERSNGPF